MAYQCDKCGAIVDELPTYEEHHPYGDTYATATMTDWDCGCGGTFDEGSSCVECGDFVLEGESYSGMCEKCLDAKIDFETVLQYSQANIDSDDFVNPLWAYLIDSDVANGVLERYVRTMIDNGGVKWDNLHGCLARYVNEDVDDFAEWLTRQKGAAKNDR